MPPVTIHLVALSSGKSVPAYLEAVRSSASTPPLVISKAVRWIIKPEKLSVSELLDPKWDLLLIVLQSSPLKEDLLSKKWLANHFTLTAGVPSSLVNGFEERNEQILHPRKGDIPASTGSKPLMAKSSQGLELNEDLLRWAETSAIGKQPVSMLNLLAFKPGKEAKESYQRYGQEFAKSAGSKRGGNAKIVGKVIKESEWDEIAFVSYTNASLFVEMLGSEDYQEINHRWRLPALADTIILCTSELDPELRTGHAKL